jgi:hypothetical protein
MSLQRIVTRSLHSAMVLGVTLPLAGCPKVPEQTSFMATTRVTASTAEVRQRSAELGRHAAAVVELAADSIRQLSDDAAVRANALKLKAQVIPAIREASLRPDPLIGLLGLMGLFYQLQDYFTSGAARVQFGPHQPIAVAMARHLIDDGHRVGLVITSGNDSAVARTDSALRAWAAEYPITNSAYVRETPLGELQSIAENVRGLGGVAANLENEVRLLQERIAFMADYSVREIAWRTTIGIEDAVGTETVDSLRALVAHSAALTGELPGLIAAERTAVLEAVRAERMAILQAILAHRQAVLDALSAERQAVMEAITGERVGALSSLAVEREAILAGADSIVQRGLDEARSLVNHVLLIVVLAGGAGIGVVGATAFVIVRYGRPPGAA